MYLLFVMYSGFFFVREGAMISKFVLKILAVCVSFEYFCKENIMQHFLIIQLARFGDLVQTKRLVKSLEARGQVHLCIDESLSGLVNLIYPNVIVHTLPAHARPSAEGLAFVHRSIRSLADYHFSAVYNLNYTGINRSLARFFEPEQVIGYAMHGGQAIHSTWVRKAFSWTQNRVTSPINLVDFWAFFDENPCSPSMVNPKAMAKGMGIGVVLAGRESRRSLPVNVLGQVVRTYFELMGGPHVFLLGSASESTIARQLMRNLPTNMQDKIQDLSGKTSWRGLIDTVEGLDVVLSPDTGTMHLAAHLGVPVQAFFLSSAWCHETGPYGEGHGVWQSVYECAPCLESAACHIQTKCLDDFSHKDFLRSLALNMQNKSANLTLPAHMVYYNSKLDELGSTWNLAVGVDAYEKRRQNLRAVLAEYLGHALVNVPILNEMAEIFYSDSDAMFVKNKF